MKKVKMLISVALAAMFSCGSVFASGSLDNFKRGRIYSGAFADVSDSDWFYNDVSNAYEFGITDGYSETEYAPYEPVSQAQAIAFGVKINTVYTGAELQAAQEGEMWYSPYVSYALEEGIIEEGVFSEKNMDKPATRAQVAYILARSIDFTDLKNINTDIVSLPDVSAYDEFYNEIVMLYRAGVVAGKDSAGRFYPNEYINRSEIAAMISRLINKDARMSVVFKDESASAAEKYDAVAIANKASSAVFYIEIYDRYGAASKSGSGFFISQDGVALTNYHVIEDGYSAKVRLVDGSVYEVESVIGYEKERDIAIVKIAPPESGFNFLELADSDLIAAGENVFCIGSPLGLENTISTGVVSNTNRVEDELSYIQISAPISSGSSGGAVLDDECKVIGISCGGYTYGQNLNLAIPINDVADVARDKNMTLYEMTTGKKPEPVRDNDEADGLEESIGSDVGYTDNKGVPDFGKIVSVSETAEPVYSRDIVTRTYVSSVDGVNTYTTALYELGFFRQRMTRVNGNVSMIFVSKSTAVLVEYNMYNSTTKISYYFDKE